MLYTYVDSVHRSTFSQKPEEEIWLPLELELQAVVSFLTCVVGTKLRLSERALNWWDFSLASKLILKIVLK